MQERKNTDKLAAAIHFLVARFPPHQLGATKLNKILWFADCEFYVRHGRSLTGETHYVRKPQGPWNGRFDSAVAHLVLHKAISERQVRVIDFVRRELYPQQEPDVTPFTSEELDLLVKMASVVSKLSAEEAAESSHKMLWECLPPDAKMPVSAGAVTTDPLDDADLERARSVLA